MSFNAVHHRLRSGRPLVLDGDPRAALEARGVLLDSPGALGRLLRERPEEVLAHYRIEVESRVDIVSALTADTTPRSLAEVGMEHRSALLAGIAVDLAQEAASESAKPVAVAGVLGSEMVSPTTRERLYEELAEHAERLKAAGCDLLVVRGQGSRSGLMMAVAAAKTTDLPTFSVVECNGGGKLGLEGNVPELMQSLASAGANAILFEVSSVDQAIGLLEQAAHSDQREAIAPGVLLATSEHSVRGYADRTSDPMQWIDGALVLADCGARVVGGGAGTTEAHTRALASALGDLHPSVTSPQ